MATFGVKTYRKAPQFTVPRRHRVTEGLAKDGDVLIRLTIQIPDGSVIFDEDWMLKSGSEVYGERIRKSGVEAGGQSLLITIAQPVSTQRLHTQPEGAPALARYEAGDLTEGERSFVKVSRFERNRKASLECLRIFGAACYVCGFDFEKIYGSIGRGFIHVHHMVPGSQRSGKYRVNPQIDLRPVCPNCHEMLHSSGRVPFSIEELQGRIATNRAKQQTLEFKS